MTWDYITQWALGCKGRYKDIKKIFWSTGQIAGKKVISYPESKLERRLK